MNDIVSPLQSLSYTNKDFTAIYEELLDLTKQLTSQWDPSISNESDPGVILLKLNAIIADKCNYAIDKSVLECFPLSVTQEANARQLFEQLGYYMHWYKAAETDVFIKWIGDISSTNITIPKFTMVTNNDADIIYTLLGPASPTLSTQYNIADQTLSCLGNEGITFKAIQGVAVNYEINGETLITTAQLDMNNRLYFPTTDIAENGIFIRNAAEENYTAWIRKDNLLVENLGNTFYSFGITRDGSACYIEFPEDVETLFKEGIYITYVRTSGEYGNVSAQYLTKFYNFNTVIQGDSVISIDENNVLVSNYRAGINGQNTQDINDAYRGYKRTVGTFNTLVTLRDYINYINNSGLVSNGFVCDRRNDIQTTYKIMSSINDVDQTITQIEPNQGVNAFTLKLYLLTYVDTVNLENYTVTFKLLDNQAQNTVKEYIYDSQTINHEFLDLLDPTPTEAHICLFKNKCPINCTIITQSALTDAQTTEMRLHIVNALYEEFNSKKLSFGDSFPYDLVYQTIVNADNRIKNVSLDNLDYTTYAVYQNSNKKLTYTNVNGTYKWLDDNWKEENPSKYGLYPRNAIEGAQLSLPTVFEEVNISDLNDIVFSATNNNELTIEVDDVAFTNYVGLEHCYEEQVFSCVGVSNTYGWVLDNQVVNLTDYGIILTGTPVENDQIHISFERDLEDGVISGSTGLSLNLNQTTFKTKMGQTTGGSLDFTYLLVSTNPQWVIDGVPANLDDYGIYVSGNADAGDMIKVRLSYAHQFRNDVYVKSVLAGITQFFIKDETFDYKLNNKFRNQVNNIEKLWSNVDISFNANSVDDIYNNIYKLKPNEALQFYAPNMIEKDRYSNFVKFEYHINHNINKDADYQLGINEYIIFYWKNSEDDVYQYHSYGNGTIIHPSFALEAFTAYTNIADNPNYFLLSFTEVSQGNYAYAEKRSAEYGDMSQACNRAVTEIRESEKILSNTKSISIKEINQFVIDTNSNYGLYWILNTTENGKYTLFTEGQSTRVLNTDEMFIFTNPTYTSYTVLGAGTELVRNEIGTRWEVTATDATAIVQEGLNALHDLWFIIPTNATLLVTENMFTTIGNQSEIKIDIPSEGSSINTYTCTAYPSSGSTLQVEYLDASVWCTTPYAGLGVVTLNYNGESWTISQDGETYTVVPETVGFTIDDTDLVEGDSIEITEYLEYELSFDHTTCNIVVPTGEGIYRVGEYPQLSDFSIKYKTIDSTEWKALGDIILNQQSGWSARSLLGIKISPTNPQILLANQSFYYMIENDDTIYNIEGANVTEEDYNNNIAATYPCGVLSSFTVSGDGGATIDTYVDTYFSGDVTREYLSLYEFELVKDLPQVTSLTNSQKVIFKDNGDVSFTFSPEVNTRSIFVSLPNGEYIIALKNYEADLNNVYIALDGIPLVHMGDRETTDCSAAGVYYLHLPISSTYKDRSCTSSIASLTVTTNSTFDTVYGNGSYSFRIEQNTSNLSNPYQIQDSLGNILLPSGESPSSSDYSSYGILLNRALQGTDIGGTILITNEHELSVHIENHSIDCTIQVSNCFKYIFPEYMTTDQINFIQDWITYLDTNKLFKYNYEVPNALKIDNPLDPKEFFSYNHIYNQFTIGQLAEVRLK